MQEKNIDDNCTQSKLKHEKKKSASRNKRKKGRKLPLVSIQESMTMAPPVSSDSKKVTSPRCSTAASVLNMFVRSCVEF